MKIFEFLFNPGASPNHVFDSYCYEPQNSQERKLGGLYIVGELKNAIPQDSRLLPNLASLLKQEYFFGASPEPALKTALKKANGFLFDRAKMGSVNWLGNLSVAALCLKDNDLYFSKDGKIKVLLLRPSQITDIGKTLEAEDFEPYPLKIFTNIISGKFLEGDKVIILTKEIFEAFSESGFLGKIALANDQHEIKLLFSSYEKEFSALSGICFMMFLGKEALPKSELTFKKTKTFSLKEIFAPILKRLNALLPKKMSFKKQKLPARKDSVPRTKNRRNEYAFTEFINQAFLRFKNKLPRPKLKNMRFPEAKLSFDWKSQKTRKTALLVSALVIILGLGFFFSILDKDARFKNSRNQLSAVQEKMVTARSYLNLGQQDKANALLKEAFLDLEPIAKPFSPVAKEALVVKTALENDLLSLNKFYEISNPDLVSNFEEKNFIPQRLMISDGDLYLFSPYEKQIIRLPAPDYSDQEEIKAEFGLNFGMPFNNSIVFFSRPEKVSVFESGEFKRSISLGLSNQNMVIADASFFRENIYLLEKNTGKIFKWFLPAGEVTEQQTPDSWILAGERKAIGAISMAVAGKVYILTPDNSIWIYNAGQWERTLNISIFPFPKQFAKIIISPQGTMMAILEPVQERVIIADKSGNLMGQFKSKDFLGLKDAVFSADGKSLYLLSGLKVFRLSL
ncbi:MAG: hypothetical protein Q8N56_00995 [bacterium]|nr:hypothetical protein [bacterium]